jgi:hypothetical protein
MWHGRAMVLAWSVLLPLGILIARFCKITSRQRWPQQLDNKAWWHAHLALQYAGGALTLLGILVLGLWSGPWRSQSAHAWFGWSVVALAVTQFVGGWLRGSKGGPTDPRSDGSLSGDHFDMTARRRLFERVHKSVGYISLAFALAAIASGLWHVNAPRWMWLLLAVWWLLLIGAGVHLQRQGRAIDTYQAIWGPDPSYPGNRMQPIGWGVRRPAPVKEHTS